MAMHCTIPPSGSGPIIRHVLSVGGATAICQLAVTSSLPSASLRTPVEANGEATVLLQYTTVFGWIQEQN